MDTDLRRRILDTSRVLLVADGYKNVSMRKIAREIGYSATSIYLYFENKDALFHALIEEGMEQLHERLTQAAQGVQDDPEARMEALCRSYIAFGLENPEYYEIMFMLHPEHMRRYPAEKYRKARRNLELFVQALEQGSERGLFAVADAHAQATAIWASLHGTVSLLLARRVDVRVQPEDVVQATVRQVICGVTNELVLDVHE